MKTVQLKEKESRLASLKKKPDRTKSPVTGEEAATAKFYDQAATLVLAN
jgi:hypothetical protein